MMEIKVAYKSAVGNYRKNNQDAVLYVKNKNGAMMAVVCDGLGGHSCGEVASNMTIKLLKHFFETTNFNKLTHDKQIYCWLEEKINYIHQEMNKYSTRYPEAADMGTTVVLVLIVNSKVYLLNIGDSRIYCFAQAQLKQLTIDHNVLNLSLQHNINLDETRNFERTYWKALTSALGPVKPLKTDISHFSLLDSCFLLLTSDGVHDFLTNEEITNILTQTATVNNKVKLLIKQALYNVSTDNVTALLIEIN